MKIVYVIEDEDYPVMFMSDKREFFSDITVTLTDDEYEMISKSFEAYNQAQAILKSKWREARRK